MQFSEHDRFDTFGRMRVRGDCWQSSGMRYKLCQGSSIWIWYAFMGFWSKEMRGLWLSNMLAMEIFGNILMVSNHFEWGYLVVYVFNLELACFYVKKDNIDKVISFVQGSEESALRLESVWTLPLMLLMLLPIFTCTMVCAQFS